MYQGHRKPIKRDLLPHNPVVFRHTTGSEHLTGGVIHKVRSDVILKIRTY